MESYELAEKNILTEIPSKYPKTFELLVLFKFIITSIFGVFSTKIIKDEAYTTITVIWVLDAIISTIMVWIAIGNHTTYPIINNYVGIGVINSVCILIHLMIGNTETGK